MPELKTVTVKDGNSYRIINESDFDSKSMEIYGGVMPRDTVTSLDKNPDGTFSEPTPTDIRYPNKDNTEFANNHGAYVHKNAAEMRADKGLADAPGGLQPDPVLAEAVKNQDEAVKKAASDEAKKNAADAKPAEAKK